MSKRHWIFLGALAAIAYAFANYAPQTATRVAAMDNGLVLGIDQGGYSE
jgi:hypothetical protein